MVAVVGVVEGVGEHDVRLGLPVNGHQPVGQLGRGEQGVVAGVEEDDLGAEGGGRLLGLLAPDPLDLLQRLALAPRLGGFAALTEGQTRDGDLLAAGRRQGDGSARSPHEVPGVRGDDECGPWGGGRVAVRHY
ncbi:hypothetical protein SAVCW2_66000 [Streptomyces avermitilis]|nr:hypothetical protein SAVCW2_66000 [Streptomyces avermitilis]